MTNETVLMKLVVDYTVIFILKSNEMSLSSMK